MKRLAFALSCLMLSGCVSMTETQCQVADWQRVGFADGASGLPESRLADYRNDCAKVGIEPDAQAYRQGWDAGIVRFCTPANAWREGTLGHFQVGAVCRAQADAERFNYYLQAGLELHRTNEKIRANNREIRHLQALLDAATNDDDKKRLRLELQTLDWEQSRLRSLVNQQRLLGP